ncbi:uncharacterized protein PGTG_22177 [Puccinia graminis f. sp. tritici CRL 75-36-700-3]|uniref:Uncharacterized protein n=1 Tax=Puccinia graminis f. sp. tritici (strain CRL 75-36-700-3 / race SCCL) TaxID=418459 RepID=H6QTU7_PUCGT|nr:uncharacterized protein PGTG_22177 [Puccinia graminis f. sp. tritici CRL 75-36-700-3]EHS64353.1 hypothetical protein PGTG_22177 [Puccinia graminis f. sp. tritici CRL 75-36-700-3]
MVEDIVTRATRKMKNLGSIQGSNVGQQQNKTSPGSHTIGKQSTQDTGTANTQSQEIVSLTEVVPAQKAATAHGAATREDAEEREHLSIEGTGGTSMAPDKEDDVVAGRLTNETQRETYRNLLAEDDGPGPLLVVNKAPPIGPIIAKAKTDRERLWDQVCQAKEAKDEANADFLLRIYLALPKESDTLAVPPAQLSSLRSSSSDAALLTQNARSVDKTVNFIRGSVPNHSDIGFTPFFDKNIREFRGPLPLTIFDKEWQEDAVTFHSGKRSKTDEKDGVYTGYEYPNEWSQSFSAWTNNFRSFLITYRDIYKIPEFAQWIVEHKANVDEIISTDGFLTGFRYDMIVRANAFAYRVETASGSSVVDISVMRKEIREKAWATTRKLEELDFTNNPYAKGGEKFGFDSKTGKPKLSKNHKSSSDVNFNSHNSGDKGNYRGGNAMRGRSNFRNRSFGGGGYGYEHTYDNGRDDLSNGDYRGWFQRKHDEHGSGGTSSGYSNFNQREERSRAKPTSNFAKGGGSFRERSSGKKDPSTKDL